MELCSAICAAMLFGDPLAEQALQDGCLAIPQRETSFGSITQASIKKWIPSLRYIINPKFLSLYDDSEKMSIRQKFQPSGKGSPRVSAQITMSERRTYELTQSLYFEEGFDWGGTVETGKIGFGLAGGSAPTGGKLDKDGFTARLTWKGHGNGTASLGVYVYSSDRSQNLPWGDVFLIEGHKIPVGEWFDTKLVVTMNSAFGESDGSLSLSVNDDVLIWHNNMQWQSQGHSLAIDKLMYSSFYGGSNSQWAPDDTTYARVSDVCVKGS